MAVETRYSALYPEGNADFHPSQERFRDAEVAGSNPVSPTFIKPC